MVEVIYSAKEGGVIFGISGGPCVTQPEPEEPNRTIGESVLGQQNFSVQCTVLRSEPINVHASCPEPRRWIGREYKSYAQCRISPYHRIIIAVLSDEVLC